MENERSDSISDEERIRDIIKYGAGIVSFILVFVTFLYKINYDTGFVFMKPLIFVLGATMFIMCGTITQITSVITKNNTLLKISYLLYISSFILYMITVDFLLIGVQGLDDNILFKIIQIILISISIIVPLGLIIFVIINRKIRLKLNNS
jgi:peptidoglycan/LPS O-acetylase OafA/YrhL